MKIDTYKKIWSVLTLIIMVSWASQLQGVPFSQYIKQDKSKYNQEKMPANHPQVAPSSGSAATSPDKAIQHQKDPANYILAGKVLQVINAGGYTYMHIAMGKGTQWIATAKMPIKKGQMIRFDKPLKMTDFYSKSLDRTFNSIYFLSEVNVNANAG
ncbi:MAG: hypothetical protein CMP10_10680 [Zetaproteobacteria bacterium]|nr:hypothetical protein [Pseudobdellovibrionaceae bacterium]|tara:strand:+ start:462 stop:929 length:468 start_codon:yes stop_codon:yes gene_type:complete